MKINITAIIFYLVLTVLLVSIVCLFLGLVWDVPKIYYKWIGSIAIVDGALFIVFMIAASE